MRSPAVVPCLPWTLVASISCRSTPPATATQVATAPATTRAPAAAPVDTLGAARDRLVAEVLQAIAGHETEPAGQVFRNVKMLTQMPARQLLAVMNVGYARSLGVGCAHCHVVGQWASEEKPQKQIARDMARMLGTINGQLLKEIPNLRGPNPVVNCTTCHRGAVRPALNLAP